MNIRKAVDYSTMFATLESVMKADLPQMELYCEIGKAVCAHSEKGAAVAAAELIKAQYPDMTGFLRAMGAGCGISGSCTAARRNCLAKRFT